MHIMQDRLNYCFVCAGVPDDSPRINYTKHFGLIIKGIMFMTFLKDHICLLCLLLKRRRGWERRELQSMPIMH